VAVSNKTAFRSGFVFGALTKSQFSQIKKSAPKAKGGKVRSSLFEMESV
jgi:hypothetical protein